MWKPITEDEKAVYTLRFQTQKAIDELLSEIYYSGYSGFVQIWPEITKIKKKLVLEVKMEKYLLTPQNSKENSVRYQIIQGKGCKKIT